MNKGMRLFIILGLVLIGALFIQPSVTWYFFTPDDVKEIVSSSREEIREMSLQLARRDITALEAQIDDDAELGEEFSRAIAAAAASYERRNVDLPQSWTAESVLAGFTSDAQAIQGIESVYREEYLAIKEEKGRIIQLGLDLAGGMTVLLEPDQEALEAEIGREVNEVELAEAVELAQEILRNRFDEFGVSEPTIRLLENNRISVELPGDNDPERIDQVLNDSASLQFQLIDEEATNQLQAIQQETPDWNPETYGIPDFIEAGSQIRPYVQKDAYGIDYLVRYVVTKEDEKSVINGSFIDRAEVNRDPTTGQPLVNFVLRGDGVQAMRDLTAANIGTQLSIVLGGDVRYWANIGSEIPTGQVQMSGFAADDANAIAKVLRTASLPLEFTVLNQSEVSSSLGPQLRDAGLLALGIGFAAVILFMIIYYKGAGFIAAFALILNMFFVLGLLSAFNFTLTLTSIAGIILTLGMAVDANVIIFERIKEEYRLGKSVAASVRAGYQKAFWTIVDSNLTTLIAALFLSLFGTGPIKGFANSLAVGIFTSVFTALFVTRLIYDFNVDVRKISKLSISWRIK